MTDEEVLAFYDELVEYYGDKLPNFEHEPKQFMQCVKLYRYYKERRTQESISE
jgi:hypothetical protein